MCLKGEWIMANAFSANLQCRAPGKEKGALGEARGFGPEADKSFETLTYDLKLPTLTAFYKS